MTHTCVGGVVYAKSSVKETCTVPPVWAQSEAYTLTVGNPSVLPPDCNLTPAVLAGVLPPPPLHGLNPNSDHVTVIRVALIHEQEKLFQVRANLINAVHWVISPGLSLPLPRAATLRKGHPKVYRLPHPVPVPERFEFK